MVLLINRNISHRFHTVAFASCNIAVLWILGVLCGWFCLRNISFSVSLTIQESPMRCRNFLYLVLCQTAPILLIAIADHSRSGYIAAIIIALKGCGAGISATSITMLYGSAGWLVYRILFFSDTFSSVVLLYLCHRNAISAEKISSGVYCIWSVIITGVCFADYLLVSNLCLLL